MVKNPLPLKWMVGGVMVFSVLVLAQCGHCGGDFVPKGRVISKIFSHFRQRKSYVGMGLPRAAEEVLQRRPRYPDGCADDDTGTEEMLKMMEPDSVFHTAAQSMNGLHGAAGYCFHFFSSLPLLRCLLRGFPRKTCTLFMLPL